MSEPQSTTTVTSVTGASSSDALPGAGIRSRLARAISVLVALVVSAQLLVLILVGRPNLRADIEREAWLYARLGAVPVCDAFDRRSVGERHRFPDIIYDQALGHPHLKAIVLTDPAGEVLYSSLGERPAAGFVAVPRLPASPKIASLSQKVGWISRLLEVRVPHFDADGEERYGVHFFFVYDSDAKATGMMAALVTLGGVLVLGFGLVLARRLSAQILEPLMLLKRGARRLAAGELGHRITLTTGDEIELLGNTLNRMAAHLEGTIEELEASNERLNRLNEELKEIDRVKGDLLANVSHELRTPLTAISGYVEALREGLIGELDVAQSASLEVVERNVQRLRAMIEQLLSFARMDSGRLEVEPRPFRLEPVARQAVEAVTAVHGFERKIQWQRPASELPEVYADPTCIAQVIENLVTNALKFSLPSEPVVLRLREVTAGVEVAVIDRGVGIPAEVQEKVFERFYQVDGTSKRKFGGMGLGLAIVRQILELNHSAIELESQQGSGSTFRFVLPFAAERTGMVPVPGRRRIALVDADAGYVQEMAAHLSKNGFIVETAATITQGYAMIQRVRPDAVLLDRMLPDGDGFDLLTRLTESPKTRGIPVVVVTARPERSLGLMNGAADYLIKPVEPRDVERTLRRLAATASRGG